MVVGLACRRQIVVVGAWMVGEIGAEEERVFWIAPRYTE
jgi:hypothetical protein